MMRKKILAKVVALGAMTTLLASSTVFAATAPTVSTRTIYLNGENNSKYVLVETTVGGLDANDEVTYLAGDASNPVYINQYTVPNSGTYTFTYKTTKDKTSVINSAVKVAKSNSSFTESAKAENGTITDTDKFTVKVKIDGEAEQTFQLEAADVIGENREIKLTNVTIPTGKILNTKGSYTQGNVSGDNVEVKVVEGGITFKVPGNQGITSVGNDNKMTENEITLTLTTKEPAATDVPFKSGVKSNSYTLSYTEGGTSKTITGPMFAIYGAINATNVAEYGIVVNESSDPKTAESGNEYYRAMSSDSEGNFGVAVIEELVASVTAKSAYVRTYVKVGDNYTYGDTLKTITFDSN